MYDQLQRLQASRCPPPIAPRRRRTRRLEPHEVMFVRVDSNRVAAGMPTALKAVKLSAWEAGWAAERLAEAEGSPFNSTERVARARAPGAGKGGHVLGFRAHARWQAHPMCVCARGGFARTAHECVITQQAANHSVVCWRCPQAVPPFAPPSLPQPMTTRTTRRASSCRASLWASWCAWGAGAPQHERSGQVGGPPLPRRAAAAPLLAPCPGGQQTPHAAAPCTRAQANGCTCTESVLQSVHLD